MLTFPNCKINIGLNITQKRDDGYHNIETIFYPVQIRDVLEIIETKNDAEIHLTGKEVSGDKENNLVWKAYHLIKLKYPKKIPEFFIFLHKVIPMGAGLGGGSADGANMLLLLNDHCKLALSKEELLDFAIQLGSDCPFFLYNIPQFASGRGEQLEPIKIDLSHFSIQVICPKIHVNTAMAFKMIDPKPSPFDLKELPQYQVKDWYKVIKNDFEPPIFRQYPELEDIKKQLYHHGALFASMSGSGSAIYGVFPKGLKANVKTSTQYEEYFME